jgi:hypothetical protein
VLDRDPDTGKPYAWGWYCQEDLIELDDNSASPDGQPEVCPIHGDAECLSWESWDMPEDFILPED